MFASKYLMKSQVQMTSLSRGTLRYIAVAMGNRDACKNVTGGDNVFSRDVYFSEQERNTVKHIIKKMNEYNSSEEPISKEQAVEETAENNVDILLEIFSKHGIKDDDMLVKDLKEWKDNL
uniref:Uncharacterized protein n=1 Tax=Euplotes harpa TaxID=151035 RepID=A0A7S3JAE7_9SPIT|mmetsp:Transcript_29046/g.33195  ORF Transcript_29046/g.33195 Transcript_29046/m.33195 type:complete len:120 (+) Transcript_29046:67-426(+)